MMWAKEFTMRITASRERVWTLWSDVSGWSTWNPGVVEAKLVGLFEAGSLFTMRLPDGDEIESTLVIVDPEQGVFEDETMVGSTRVNVTHRCGEPSGGSLPVTYSAVVIGPDAAEIGNAVTADFEDVLASLKRVAETA